MTQKMLLRLLCCCIGIKYDVFGLGAEDTSTLTSVEFERLLIAERRDNLNFECNETIVNDINKHLLALNTILALLAASTQYKEACELIEAREILSKINDASAEIILKVLIK